MNTAQLHHVKGFLTCWALNGSARRNSELCSMCLETMSFLPKELQGRKQLRWFQSENASDVMWYTQLDKGYEATLVYMPLIGVYL
jgi:hypothetical protein